ncbi:MAG: hypothetical protein AAB225_01675 [Acidobacteriota bacterium]
MTSRFSGSVSGPVALILSCLLVVECAAAPAITQAPPSAGLKIVVLEGDGAINNIGQRLAKAPVVRVEDENSRPLAKAAVIFLLPEHGAGGTFLDRANSLTVSTDEKGVAVGRGLRPNNVAGEFQIRVVASFQGQTASVAITQTNAPGAKRGGGGKAVAIVALIAGAGAGAAFAARGSAKSPPAGPTPTPPTPSPGTTFAPGTPIFGPPR